MISTEDMAVVHARLLQESDENLALRAAVDAEHNSSRQIPLLRKHLSDIEKAMIADCTFYQKEESFLQSQLTALSKRVNTIPDPSALELRLADDTDRLSGLIEIESQLIDDLSVLALQEDDLGAKRDAIKICIAKYQVMEPQVQSCLGLAMLVQDGIARIDQQAVVRGVQKGKRKRLTNWLAQTEEVGAYQREALAAVKSEELVVVQSVLAREADLRQVERVLSGLGAEFTQLRAMVEAEGMERERVKKDGMKEIQRALEDIRKAEEEVAAIEKATDFMRHDVATYHISERKLIQKKLDMVQQLSKRLQNERKNVMATPVAAAVVDDLTESLSAEMVEKQELIDAVKMQEEKIKWLRAENERKSIIIRELRGMAIPKSGEKRSEEELLADIDDFLGDIQVQNEVHFENLQIAGFEAEGLEAEGKSLDGFLRDVSTDDV
jgi:hypothetical protein